jgi:hypothetical protein
MFTGEIGPPVEQPHKPRRADIAFTAAIRLWGYEGQVLTKSLRGACNKAVSEIKQAEREADPDVALDKIAELIDGFGAWFIKYRRERFNENYRRYPYPMETAKLWPEYRKTEYNNSSKWDADKARYALRQENKKIAESWRMTIEDSKR